MKTTAAPIPTQASPGLSTPNRPRAMQHDAEPSQHHARWRCADACSVEVSSTAPSRSPVTGGTRVARSAGISAASTARPVPSTSETTIVRVCDHRARASGGRSRARRRAPDHRGEGDTGQQSEHRGEQPDRERLDHHRGDDLAAVGAEGAQHRELAGALGDRDREGVEDQERGDEQGDAREDQQRRLEDADELADVVLLVLGVLLAGLDLDAGRAGPPEIRCASSSGSTPSSAATVIWSNCPACR